ncbi:aminotransferase class IV [Streptomyces flavofungini]|uniref:aminotransferase class IV n=1 Tax=Streptomyces flavofungini TaxID=68200 RepID=UPI0025B1453D|nr:aminotransferase class IV [Streptomyces flavofungini]WJV44966.1 aminotransferase class IV [Streptomyces flavofungini]
MRGERAAGVAGEAGAAGEGLRSRGPRVTRLDGRPATADDLAALALYNYGHFTTLRVEHGRARGLALHLRRLADDCRTLFAADLDTRAVRGALRRVAERSEGPVTVRVTVCAPEMSLDCPEGLTPLALISTRPAPPDVPPPLRLATATYVRDLPEVKHTGLFGALRLRGDARRRGFDDALLLDRDGRVQEGTTFTICCWDGTRLLWPRAACLPGVTARLLREAATAGGVPTLDAPVTRGELGALRGVFATNAAFGVRPVAAVDGTALPVDPELLTTLRTLYAGVPAEPL